MVQSKVTSLRKFHELISVVKQNADVFALEESELECTSVVQREIHTGDYPPVKQPIDQMPFVYQVSHG